MTRSEIETALAAAIDAESAVGIRWWPGREMAPLAFRRWSSFARRHKKTRQATAEDRVLDLAKGLQSHFEPDTPFTPLSEWLHLARRLADVFSKSQAEGHGAAERGGAVDTATASIIRWSGASSPG
jgi:hypothetical protein